MGESMFLTSWVVGEKKFEGSLCVVLVVFCSAASDETTSGSAASTGPSAGCVFYTALRRVAAFLPHLVVLFTAWGSLARSVPVQCSRGHSGQRRGRGWGSSTAWCTHSLQRQEATRRQWL